MKYDRKTGTQALLEEIERQEMAKKNKVENNPSTPVSKVSIFKKLFDSKSESANSKPSVTKKPGKGSNQD